MGTRYMIATKALHMMGDISSDVGDLCVIHREEETDYIGEWVTGFGFMEVRFPKETTRELTEDEKEKWNGALMEIGEGVRYAIQIPGAKNTVAIPKSAFIVETSNSVYEFDEADENGVYRVLRRDKVAWREKASLTMRYKILSLVIGKRMLLMPTEGSGGLLTTSTVVSVDV